MRQVDRRVDRDVVAVDRPASVVRDPRRAAVVALRPVRALDVAEHRLRNETERIVLPGKLAEPRELRIRRALDAGKRNVVFRRSVLDAVEEAGRELEDRRRVQDAGVVDLAYVDVEVVALPDKTPPRRGAVDVDADGAGIERLVLDCNRVFVGRPIVAAEHVLPARPVDAGLLRDVVVAVDAGRVRHRVQVEEAPGPAGPGDSRESCCRGTVRS